MNYHLSRDGQNLGVFTLEELRRRRAAGELTGSELIWTEGMPQWLPLNAIMPPGTPGAITPPIQSAPRPSRVLFWVLLITGLMIAGFLAMAVIGYRMVVRPMLKELSQHSAGDLVSPLVQSAAMEAASKPVVIAPNSLTAADVTKSAREFRIRQYLDGYKLRGERNPECDALALGMISNWIACNYEGVVDTNLPSLQELGNRLANDPQCTDPLVLTVAAVNAVELHEANRRLERAVKGFQNSKHLGYPKLFAIETLAEKLIIDRNDRLPVLDAQGLGYLQDAFTDGSIRPEDQPDIANSLVCGWGKSFLDRNGPQLYGMVQREGEPYRWLALVLQGESEINEAWKARGDGYSDAVSQSGWQGFNQHLATARDCLTQAWELNKNWPLAPTRMMTVSLGDSGIGEMRKWFDRAVAAQFDYADAWSEMRWGLRPRWYGDTDSMMAFGVMALNTGRFDTAVPRVFFDALSDVEAESDLPAGQHLYERPAVWQHLKLLYEGYIAYPEQSDWCRDDWRSTYAVVAYLAGKYDVSAAQLKSLDWQPHPGSLIDWKRDLSLMPLEAAARTGPQSQAVTEAESDGASGDIAGALKIYNRLATESDEDARTRAFALQRQYCLDFQQRLASGNWVAFLPPDAAFTGWQTNFGDFKVLSDGALEVHSDENCHMIYCRAPINANFEVRGQFEVVSSTSTAFQAGVVMGLPQFDSYGWDAFRIKRNTDEGDVASFSEHWTKHQILAPLNNLDSRTNSFDLRFQGGRVTASVNGHEIFTNANPPENYQLATDQFLLGLGAFGDSDSTVIRYRNVEVRKR